MGYSLAGQPYYSYTSKKKKNKKSQLHDVPEIAKHCTHIKQGFSGALYYVPHAFLQNSQLIQYRCYWELLSIAHVDKLQACSSEGEIASYMKLATSNPLISSSNTITCDAIPYEDVLLGVTPVVGSPHIEHWTQQHIIIVYSSLLYYEYVGPVTQSLLYLSC